MIHCKNVMVISTLSGLSQLHLFRSFYKPTSCSAFRVEMALILVVFLLLKCMDSMIIDTKI